MSAERTTAGDAPEGDAATAAQELDDAMAALIRRLARPHKSGGYVVERASLLAEGHDFAAALAWIEAHGGVPESAVVPVTRGLHSARTVGGGDRPPLRFVLPAGAWD